MNLYNILQSIVEQIEENTDSINIKDIKNIKEFIDNYNITDGIKNISVTFGYSTLALGQGNFESVNVNDLKKLDKNIEIAKREFTITNNNVLNVLNYIKSKIQSKINKKVKAEDGTVLPFIIIISWNHNSIEYKLTVNLSNNKLFVNEYSINNVDNQVDTVQNFITSRKKQINDSPFRLLGSILIFNDWLYGWDKDTFEKEIENRRIK